MPRKLRRVYAARTINLFNLLINNQMPTISTNKELLNVINEDVQNVKQFTKMPAISEELYNELLEEFNNDSYYFFN